MSFTNAINMEASPPSWRQVVLESNPSWASTLTSVRFAKVSKNTDLAGREILRLTAGQGRVDWPEGSFRRF